MTDQTQQPRVVILGGGPCGLGAALRLTELQHSNWTLYESEDRVGGLSRSIPDDKGFIWDIGGHVIFSHYKYFDDVLEHLGPEETVTLNRKCLIFLQDGNFEINYPLQNHVDELPPQHWQKCLDGLLDSYVASHKGEFQDWKPSNFGEWGRRVLGEGLLEVFLRPYNEKLWAWPLEEMSADWLGERVAVPDFKKVMAQFTRLVDRPPTGRAAELSGGWGPNTIFKFSMEGGTGGIWTSVGDRLPADRMKMNMKATAIDPETKTITFADGSTDTYDRLINTISVQTFTRDLLVAQYSKKALLEEAAFKLKYSSLLVIGLGIRGPEPERLSRFHWGYFPAADVPFYRCTVLSHYSPKLVPQDKGDGQHYYSLLFECSHSAYRSEEPSTEDRIAATEAAARKYLLIDDNVEVVSRWSERFQYGYPTPSIHRDSLLREIHGVLEPLNIFSRGRFGGWKYEVGNMDHSLMQGVEIVDRLVQTDSPLATEPTYNTPNYVNNPSNRGTLSLNLEHFKRRTEQKETFQDISKVPTTDIVA